MPPSSRDLFKKKVSPELSWEDEFGNPPEVPRGAPIRGVPAPGWATGRTGVEAQNFQRGG